MRMLDCLIVDPFNRSVQQDRIDLADVDAIRAAIGGETHERVPLAAASGRILAFLFRNPDPGLREHPDARTVFPGFTHSFSDLLVEAWGRAVVVAAHGTRETSSPERLARIELVFSPVMSERRSGGRG